MIKNYILVLLGVFLCSFSLANAFISRSASVMIVTALSMFAGFAIAALIIFRG